MEFKKLISFLESLNANNNKEWFEKNRSVYDSLKLEWVAYIDNLIHDLILIDPSIGDLEAKKCIFRINKDVRFSKDKLPYKTNFGAILNRGGKKEMTSGYYIHVDPKEIFIAGGAYQPSPDFLSSIRQEIDYNFEEFHEIVNNKSLKQMFGGLGGEKLLRPPKGYLEGNLAIDYLKHKSFVLVHNFTKEELFSKAFSQNVLKGYKEMKPLNDFLNRCLESNL